MSEPERPFKGARGFLWLAVGVVLLVAVAACIVYLVFHLTD